MKIIHCNLWGDLEISDLAIQIIDTPHFQRLHYIRQTGLSYKVFPGAHTTRFEHSIGVYGVTRMLLDQLIKNQPELLTDCNERTQELICIAGLIHDLGHGPFSHLFDTFLEIGGIDNEWIHHENRSLILFRHLVSTYQIPMTEEEVQFLEGLIKGNLDKKYWYRHLINNSESGLDMDKMDYVLRDSMMFGMKIQFDARRIMKNCRVIENELSFCDRIQDEIVTVFMIRNKMNRFIYRHPKICQFENCLLHFLFSDTFDPIREIIQDEDVDKFMTLNDTTILFMIPSEDWSPIECREMVCPIQHDTSWQEFREKEWYKIQRLWFYKKKEPNERFRITHWKMESCF